MLHNEARKLILEGYDKGISVKELAMTGRDPAPWMLDAADYITEMCCRRHPYEKGIPARKGVEF